MNLQLLQSRPSNELADMVMLQIRLLCDIKRELEQKLLKSEGRVTELKIENEVLQKANDDLRMSHHRLSVTHEILKRQAGPNTQPANAGPTAAIASTSTSRRETNTVDNDRRAAAETITINDADGDKTQKTKKVPTVVQTRPIFSNRRFSSFKTGEKQYSCTRCGKKYNRVGFLKRHMRIHSSAMSLKCKLCRGLFRTSNDLKKHVCSQQK